MEGHESLIISLVTLAAVRIAGALLFVQWLIQKREIRYVVITTGWLLTFIGVAWGLFSLVYFGEMDRFFFSLFSGIGTLLIFGGALLYYNAIRVRTILIGSVVVVIYGVLPMLKINTGPSPGLIIQFLVALIATWAVLFRRKELLDYSYGSYLWLAAMAMLSLGLTALFSLRIIGTGNMHYGFMGTSIVQLVALIYFLHLEYSVSDRKTRLSENRYRSLFENAPVALWEEDLSYLTQEFTRLKSIGIKDIKSYAEKHPSFIREMLNGLHILDVNKASLSLHEVTDKEVLLQNPEKTFTADSFSAFSELVFDLFNGESEITKEVAVKTLKGKELQVSLKLSLIRNNSSVALISMTDISDLKEITKELVESGKNLEKLVEERTNDLKGKVLKLNRAQEAMLYMVEDLNKGTKELKSEREKLYAANSEMEAFAYSVSHDLRAPLRGIHGFTQILMEEYSGKMDEEFKRICSIIWENSHKMGKLIDDLLSFSRLGRAELQKSVIDMGGMVKSIYFEITDEETRKRVVLNIDNICEAHGDPAMIKQVWANLLSNAIKFSSKKRGQIFQ